MNKMEFLFKKVSLPIRLLLQYDEEALYSTTDQVTCEKMARIIDKYVTDKQTLVDATACIGGSAFSLSAVFQKVIAIEKDPSRYNYLTQNLEVLGVSDKVTAVCADCVDYVTQLHPVDAIFIDPPWGGPQYKQQDKIDLYLSDTPLHTVCQQMAKHTKYIVLKVPTNFDEDTFLENTACCLKLIHKNDTLRKMNLLILYSSV